MMAATPAHISTVLVATPPATTTTTTATVVTPIIPEQHPISGFVNIWGFEVNLAAILLAAITLVVLYALWKAQRDHGENTFNVWDLVMDTIPPSADLPRGGRKASVIKTCFMGAFVLSTWLVFYMAIIQSPQLTPVFTTYMATWGTALIAKVIWDQKGPPQFVLPQSGKPHDGDGR